MALFDKKINRKQQSDWELIQACRQNEQDAWAELVLRYERLVFWIPRKQYGMSESDAADIMQSVFAIMVKSLGSFHAESNLKSWLVTVTKRHAWRVIEKNKRETTFATMDTAESDLVKIVDDRQSAAQFETAQWLNAGLHQLKERCRQLLTLLYLAEHEPSYEEVAVTLGIKKGSIGPTRARCLSKLRSILEENG